MSPRRGLMWGGNILPGVTHPAWFYRPFGTFLKISNTNYKPSIIKLPHISFFYYPFKLLIYFLSDTNNL